MLNFALRRGYVESIPGTLHITMPTVDNKVTENLTAEQVQKLLKALDEEADQVQASIVRLALFTGMRRSALLNLQWNDLDFERGFIKAEVVNYQDLLDCGSYAGAREKGLVRMEGKDYIVRDGDVILFRFNV